MNLDQVLNTFIAESRELLEDMENALLAVEQAEERTELVNAIFRAAHTIKGSAGLFGLDDIVAFTHLVESALDRVRSGTLAIDSGLIALLLACRDYIAALVESVAQGQLAADAEMIQRGAPLVEALRAYLGQTQQAAPHQADHQAPHQAPPQTPQPAQPSVPAVPSASDAESQVERLASEEVGSDHWHISLRFGRDVLRNGMDPLSFIRYLATIGVIVNVVTLPDALPDADQMDPESCYLGYEIAFKSEADKTTIENVFDFVRDDCQIRILPPKSKISDYVRLLQDLPEKPVRIGELLVQCGTLTASELDAALNTQAAEPAQPLGQILIEQHSVQPEVVEAALNKQKQIRETHAQESRSVRVDAEKLDQLINLVGELIIAGASASLIARRSQAAELQEAMSKVSGLVENVRDSALQLRMVKIGATFNRFQRVVHDVARDLGKDIGLVIDGEDTELDKTVVEKIGDPLTHLVRNAMDHGIEPADVRAARGKPAKGMVKLDAYHDSGSIVIEVSDDGGGLKREKILAKAVERGLVEPGHHLSDEDVYKLIFEPGFSTADHISNLSGRGVGLDVVKRNIAALRGSVDVHSEEGIGTTVKVRLPLTLAIIDGFLVEVGQSIFAVPLDMIEECIAYSAEAGHDYTNLRGEVLPLIRLRTMFEVEGEAARRENIVVVKHAGKKAGLVVDTLLGEFQTVIKPLGKVFNRVRCISGSTILGSGDVALILDVPALVQEAAGAPTAAQAGENNAFSD